MGFGNTSLLCKIVFFLLILCFIIDLIGFAIPYWYSTETTALTYSYKVYSGLWLSCTEVNYFGQTKVCGTFDILSDWYRAVRAFSILSWLCFLAALVLVIIFMFFLSEKMLYLVAICLSFAGAFCAMIAFAVYAGESKLKEFSGGFALTVIAFILGLIIGILGILDYLGVGGGKVGNRTK